MGGHTRPPHAVRLPMLCLSSLGIPLLSLAPEFQFATRKGVMPRPGLCLPTAWLTSNLVLNSSIRLLAFRRTTLSGQKELGCRAASHGVHVMFVWQLIVVLSFDTAAQN